MDLAKIPIPLLKILGFRGAQLAVLIYLFARYTYALADHNFRTALTGGQTQAVIMGYDIPYEVVTMLTPAIVVWAEILVRRFGHSDSRILKRIGPEIGLALSLAVCFLSTSYFWVVGYASTRNLFSGDVRPTTDMAMGFTAAALLAAFLVWSTRPKKAVSTPPASSHL